MTTTSSAWASRCRAWTPQPVPTSRARSTWGRGRPRRQRRRGTTDAEHVVLAQRGAGWPAHRGRRRPTSPRRRRRTGAGRTARRRPSPSGARGPARRRRRRRAVGRAAAASRDVDRVAEREQPHEGRAGLVGRRRHPLGGQRLLAVERGRRHRAEQLGDPATVNPDGDEVRAQRGRRARGRRGAWWRSSRTSVCRAAVAPTAGSRRAGSRGEPGRHGIRAGSAEPGPSAPGGQWTPGAAAREGGVGVVVAADARCPCSWSTPPPRRR